MDKIKSVEEYLDQNTPTNLGDLFSFFQTDLDSVIIACHFLNWDSTTLSENLKKINFSETELIERIDYYHNYPELFFKMIPCSVRAAIVLYISVLDLERSKSMVETLKNEINYLNELDKENIFDEPIIFFASKINLHQDYLAEINEKILKLDVIFQEPEYKNILSHFEMASFFQPDIETQEKFVSIINSLKQDSFTPIMVTNSAEIINNKLYYKYDCSLIEGSILGLSNKIDFLKLKNKVFDKLKNEFSEELGENAFKFALGAGFGLSAIDVGIKSAKLLILSLHESFEDLETAQIKRDFVEFKDSNHSSVKEWYMSKIKNQINSTMKESGMSVSVEECEKITKTSYQNFIKRYFNAIGLVDNGSLNEDHTKLFLRAYEAVNSYSIKLNSDY